jgi:hypothetical protein
MKKANWDLIITILFVVRAVTYMLTIAAIIIGVEFGMFELHSWMMLVVLWQFVTGMVLALISICVPYLNHES